MAGWRSTPADRTERRANASIPPGWTGWAGGRRSHWRRGSGRPMSGTNPSPGKIAESLRPAPVSDLHARLYTSLYRIRRVEEEIARVYPTDKIKSPVHLSLGQEAVSVGVCEALRADDVVFGTYRCHALYLAKGGDLKDRKSTRLNSSH